MNDNDFIYKKDLPLYIDELAEFRPNPNKQSCGRRKVADPVDGGPRTCAKVKGMVTL
jgi:hypothetical protein